MCWEAAVVFKVLLLAASAVVLICSALRVTQQCWALYRTVPYTPPTPQIVINKFLSNKRADLNTRSTVVLPIRRLPVVAHYAGFRTRLCSTLASSALLGPSVNNDWMVRFLSKRVKIKIYPALVLRHLCFQSPLPNIHLLICALSFSVFAPFG